MIEGFFAVISIFVMLLNDLLAILFMVEWIVIGFGVAFIAVLALFLFAKTHHQGPYDD